jgi:hypothetical protein
MDNNTQKQLLHKDNRENKNQGQYPSNNSKTARQIAVPNKETAPRKLIIKEPQESTSLYCLIASSVIY